MADRVDLTYNPNLPARYRRVPGVAPSSTGSGSIQFQGGQGVIISVKNLNVLGVTFSVIPNRRAHPFLTRGGVIILPAQTALFHWAVFGSEPMNWSFDLETSSDACIVETKAFSTWIQGMPPNR